MRIAEYKQIDTKIVEKAIIIPAQYDEEGNVTVEEHTETVRKEIPVMGMVYRDAAPEEEAQMQTDIPIEEQIVQLKEQLSATDYKAIKYAEGWLTDGEYAPIKAEREKIRQEIRDFETSLMARGE